MKKFLIYVILTALFIFAMETYYNYDMRRINNIRIALRKEYPSIGFEEGLNARITKIYNGDPKVFRNHPHQIFLVLDNSLNKDIRASFELNQKLTIDEVASIGDRFIKEPNSYMFNIYKISEGDTLKYEFELRDSLGYSLNKQKRIIEAK